jgi:RNA polymerase sigma factor (sigma-70 family)
MKTGISTTQGVNAIYYAMRILHHRIDMSQAQTEDQCDYSSSEFSPDDHKRAYKIIDEIQKAEKTPISELSKNQIELHLSSLAEEIDELTTNELINAGFYTEEGELILEKLRRSYHQNYYSTLPRPSGIENVDTESQRLGRELEDQVELVEAEIERYWDDPTWELISDREFQDMLDRICQQDIRSFKVPSIYTWEDLKQDVLIRFGKLLVKYRGEAQLSRLVTRIARNLLIDLHRQRDQRISVEDLELAESAVEATNNDPREALQSMIELHESLLRMSTDQERELFIKYFIEGKTLSEIAREQGITRQAISKRISQITKKLKPYEGRA